MLKAAEVRQEDSHPGVPKRFFALRIWDFADAPEIHQEGSCGLPIPGLQEDHASRSSRSRHSNNSTYYVLKQFVSVDGVFEKVESHLSWTAAMGTTAKNRKALLTVKQIASAPHLSSAGKNQDGGSHT